MCLIGKLLTTQTTILLFKLRDSTDKNNVFAICPLHVLDPNTYKVKVQVVIEEECNNIKEIIHVTVCLFPIQHTFLDIAMGVVENPEVINNNQLLKGLSYLNTSPGVYGCLTNKPGKILYANKNGVANSLDTKILSMNYTLGDRENLTLINGLPAPGGFILTDFNADIGSSGSVLTVDNNVLGIIVAAANLKDLGNGTESNTNSNYSLAVDMFYILPHINQCVSAIDKFTNNNPDNLARLCLFTTMRTFRDDLRPVVNSLGSSYIFHHMTTRLSPQKYITLTDIQNFLSVSSLRLYQEGVTDSIRVETLLNRNHEFVDYFFNKQQNSVVIFKRANYYDKVLGKRVDIDFVNDPVNANILDWSFRGDQFQPLVLHVQTRSVNNDGSVSLSAPVAFTFLSSPTTDVVHNVNYTRTTAEIPGVFFNRNDALAVLMNSFHISSATTGMPVFINFLSFDPWRIVGGVAVGVGRSTGNLLYNRFRVW